MTIEQTTSTSVYDASMSISKIHPHPKNPRREAIADDDMVASIREAGVIQAVTVVPHPTIDDEYYLIAGHRRYDGATKAKQKHLPVVIRTDLITEGQQIEFMCIENLHREDFTPMEEAEAFQQLELIGYKPAGIATATGRNVKTVRSRLSLLKLSETTQTKVHSRQLAIEDAIAIGEFSDDPDTVTKLEKAATGGNLKYELSNARQRRERIQENAALVAQLVDAGATAYTLPAEKALWKVLQDKEVRRVSATDHDDWSEHGLCLGYLETTGSWPSIDVLCLQPGNHEDADVVRAEEAKAAAEERQRENAERVAAENAAASARVGLLGEVLTPATLKVPAALVDLVRVLLPNLIARYDADFGSEAFGPYAEVLAIPEGDQWHAIAPWGPQEQRDRRATLFAQHLEEIANGTAAYVMKALSAFLIASAEFELDVLEADVATDRSRGLDYFDLLKKLGHVETPQDHEILERLLGTDAESDA